MSAPIGAKVLSIECSKVVFREIISRLKSHTEFN